MHTTIVTDGGNSGIAIVAIIVLLLLGLLAFLWLGGGAALFPSQVDINVDTPEEQAPAPSEEQPQEQQPAQPEEGDTGG